MTGRITSEEFGRIWRTFERSVFKVEMRDRYNVAGEEEWIRKWRAGEQDPSRAKRPWLDMIRELTEAGKAVQRVRVVTEPHSEYVRFGLSGAGFNVAAGEDIRYLSRQVAERLDVPAYDWMLVDDRTVLVLPFDDDDRPAGWYDVIDDPAVAARHAVYREAIWPVAVPFADYVRR